MRRYILKRLLKGKKVIGIGTRRIVYDLRNGKVLKIAKSKFGINIIPDFIGSL